MARVAVVVPLRRGAHAQARSLVATGSPFDLEGAGLAQHGVFLTRDEVVFVFDGAGALARRLSGEDPALWRAAAAWGPLVAGPPRVGVSAWGWSRIEEPEGATFGPTPGPGDSEGGDVYPPSSPEPPG